MEPNCAICNGPAYRQCPCEHQSLILAVEQSEQRVLHPMWDEIRYWVTTQAKAEIHRDFQARSSYRRAQHSNYLSQNTGRFTNEMLDRVNRDLQHGIDDDWRTAVQRYPEVLDYFYSMVAWTVRGDCMSGQRGPMLSPRTDMANADGYFCGSSGLRGMPHGPLPSPIGGGGPLDGKPTTSRPFYRRNNSYGGSSYSESSGYGSGTGSPSSTGSRALPFQTFSYGRPPPFRP